MNNKNKKWKRREEIKHLYCYLVDFKNKALYKMKCRNFHELKKLTWLEMCVLQKSADKQGSLS